MNIALGVINLIVSLVFVHVKLDPKNKYYFIQAVCESRIPDLLIADSNSNSLNRMLRLIPVKSKDATLSMDIVLDNSSGSSRRAVRRKNDDDHLDSSNFNSDVYFLRLAVKNLDSKKELDELVYEMLVRFVGSFIDSCTYPKAYEREFEMGNFDEQEIRGSPFNAFIRLVDRRETRDVVMVVLDSLIDYLVKTYKANNLTATDSFSNEVKFIDVYLNHFYKAAKYIKSQIGRNVLIEGTDDRKLDTKSFIMISSKNANNTGDYVINATSFMDTAIPF